MAAPPRAPARRALVALVALVASCSFADRARDAAEVLGLAVAVGPEVSVGLALTDACHLAVGGGAHVEAGLVDGRAGAAGVLTLGLPAAPFLEGGVLHGRYLFTETSGAWTAEDVEDECYLVHLVEAAPTHPAVDPWRAWDLEVGFVVGVGARLGFSPGELVDFLAGLVGLDPQGDDGPRGAGATVSP